MEKSIFKKTISKGVAMENHPSGNLFEEISEQDLSLVAGGTNDSVSKWVAKKRGMKGYGGICTISAECNFTQSCWD